MSLLEGRNRDCPQSRAPAKFLAAGVVKPELGPKRLELMRELVPAATTGTVELGLALGTEGTASALVATAKRLPPCVSVTWSTLGR